MKCEDCREDMTSDETDAFVSRCGWCEASHFAEKAIAAAQVVEVEPRQIVDGTATLH